VKAGGPVITSISQRIFEAFGSTTNWGNFLLVQDQINQMKGNLFGLLDPIGNVDSEFRYPRDPNRPNVVSPFEQVMQRAAGGDAVAEETMLSYFRNVSTTSLVSPLQID
jgi:hypothetical protein